MMANMRTCRHLAVVAQHKPLARLVGVTPPTRAWPPQFGAPASPRTHVLFGSVLHATCVITAGAWRAGGGGGGFLFGLRAHPLPSFIWASYFHPDPPPVSVYVSCACVRWRPISVCHVRHNRALREICVHRIIREL